jgi:quinoprotein relay system zinc metallohydrolase 2
MVEPPVMAKKAKPLRELSAFQGALRALSRRELCCGTAALLCCLPALRAVAEALRDRPLALSEIAPGIHVSHGVHAEAAPDNQGAIANVGFVVGSERVAVIDSGGCLLWGQRLREAVRRVTHLPISHLVQTHMHPDHVFGAAAFLADSPVILGHRRLPAALASRQAYYTRRLHEILGDVAAGSVIVPPNQIVDGESEIDLGGRVLRITAHRSAHTDNDLSLRDLATGTLWAGDLLFMERVPALDGSLIGWLAVLDELRAQPAARVVPGHGPVAASWPAAADAQHRYLTLLRGDIRQMIKSGGTMEQAIATIGQSERPRWRLFDDYHARNVTAAFHELEWE